MSTAVVKFKNHPATNDASPHRPIGRDRPSAWPGGVSTRKATVPFKDIRAARKAGYTVTSRYSPGVGFHVTNPAYWALAAHGVFDPARPPSLLYNRINGAWTLIGVMYVAPTADTSSGLGQIFPESLVTWHQHLGLCFAGFQPVRGATTSADCQARGDAWVAQTAWMTHAWIWQDHPDGMFTLKNATVGLPS